MKTTRRNFLASLGAGIGALVASKAFSQVEQVGEQEGRYPLLYTDQEGGRWKQWPNNKAVNDSELTQRAEVNVLIGGKRVHSLRFWERKGEFIGWKRWDCVNGWNRISEPVFMPTSAVDFSKQNQALLQQMIEDGFSRLKRRRRRKL